MTSNASPVVVGVDGSERSRDAVELAARLADPGQPVLLVHVHPFGEISSLLSGGDYEQLIREVAESTLSAVQDVLAPGVQREMRLVADRSPAAGLEKAAEETAASLIVVGTAREAGATRLGSVGESLFSGAPAPVAIAPPEYAPARDELQSIGCGFNDTPEAHNALRWAAALARRRGARLVALAAHTRVAFGALSTTGAVGYRSANEELRATLEQRAREAVDSLGGGLEADCRLLDGDAATELANASKELDLLVLGSRGYGPLRRVFVGSVARAVVRTSSCPVVVLPRGFAETG
jgi:nucleotide-binding universal stress UspA family protein